MAYQYRQQVGQTKKTKFIALNAGYHGDTLGTVSVGGIQLFHQVFHNLLFKPLTLPSPGASSTNSLHNCADGGLTNPNKVL